jgi:integrase
MKSTVKVANVTITVAPWKHPSGQDYWRFAYLCPFTGKRKWGTRATLEKAKKAARDKAVVVTNGEVDPSRLSETARQNLRRLLTADPDLRFTDDYLRQMTRAQPQVPLTTAFDAFLAVKEANRGASVQNVRSLERYLEPLLAHCGRDRIMSDVTGVELQNYIDGDGKRSARYRLNFRRCLVTFWRWARKMGYVGDHATEAEKAEMPIVSRKIPGTYTVDQMHVIMFSAAREHLPWFALAAFGGIRGDEMLPLAGGEKSPLDWSDVDWTANHITIRPETAKTKHRRIVPLNAALRSWLEPCKADSGPIVTLDPRRGHSKDDVAETTRLGRLVDGWKPNALRHSYISYRAAQIGLGKTAMEAGNSESEAKRSYNSAMSETEANRYFQIVRGG